MPTALQVARYFCAKMEADAGDVVSSRTLHKLLYYAQGFSLAILGEELFDEWIYARAGGPFCRELAKLEWTGGALLGGTGRGLRTGVGMDVHDAESWAGRLEEAREPFSEEQLGILDDVWIVYGQFAGWKLREIVWDDALWRRHWERALNLRGDDAEIPQEEMRSHFRLLLAEGEARHGR